MYYKEFFVCIEFFNMNSLLSSSNNDNLSKAKKTSILFKNKLSDSQNYVKP